MFAHHSKVGKSPWNMFITAKSLSLSMDVCLFGSGCWLVSLCVLASLSCCGSYQLFTTSFTIILEKEKVLRKHSLHRENSSLGFIEAIQQW